METIIAKRYLILFIIIRTDQFYLEPDWVLHFNGYPYSGKATNEGRL